MKKGFLFGLALVLGVVAMAQSDKQVHFSYLATKIADKTYELHITATIGGDYHLYAQNPGGEGPIPTKFTFTKNPLTVIDAKVKEKGTLVTKYEQAWAHNVRYYEKEVEFIVLVKVKGTAKTKASGKVEFMVCNDHECLPPAEVEFSVPIGG